MKEEDVLVLSMEDVTEWLDYLNTKVPPKFAVPTIYFLRNKINEQHPEYLDNHYGLNS
jgi:hypothetical protein